MNVSAFAVVAAITVFLLKDFGWKGTPVFCLIALIGILSFLEPTLNSLSDLFSTVGEGGGLAAEAQSVLKVIGIGYVSGITSEVCRDLGALSIASVVSLVARLEVLLLVTPYLVEVLRLGMELL